MTYKPSLRDQITRATVKLIRVKNDVKVKIGGTKTSVLRITTDGPDILGDRDHKLDASIINNVIINYPLSQAEIFAAVEKTDPKLQIAAVDLWEFLPITMRIPFHGDYKEDPVEVKKNDIIVDVLYDHNGTKIPIVHQVTRLRGAFFGKYLSNRAYELSLFRGIREKDIEKEIQNYIAKLP